MTFYLLYAVVLAALQLVSGGIYMKVPFSEVEEGAFASFECLQTGTHRNVRVLKWLFNGAPLPRDTRMTTARSPYYNVLMISMSLPKHSGVYTCVARDGREIRNASRKLIVACPIVPYSQPITRAVLGTNASLQCDAKCYRYILWAKNDYMVATTESERFSSPGNGSILYISNVSLSDNGTFICDFFFLKMKRSSVQLHVIVPADRVTTTKSRDVAEIGHRYELQCQSNGNPRPESVSWFNNSVPISNTTRVTTRYDRKTGTATLTIHCATRYDFASIECRFKQELETGKYKYVTATTLITPTGKPDAPDNVTLDLYVSSKLKFLLSWNAPSYTGHLRMLAYRVTYWNDDKCPGTSVAACSMGEYWLDDSVLSHQFEPQGYSRHARVCVSVQSVNNNGLSIPSKATCVGVRRSPPPSPSPYVSRPPTHEIENTHARVPKTRTEFQALLLNSEPCSETKQVSQDIVTIALASHFSWLCSCDISPSDLIVVSYVHLGGIVYYHGTLVSSTAEYLITNLAQNIQTGEETLRLYDNDFLFLHTCPTIPSEGMCSVSMADRHALSCRNSEDKLRQEATAATTTEDNAPWLTTPSIVVIAVLVCLLTIAIVISIVIVTSTCHHNQTVGDKNDCKTPSQSEFTDSNTIDHVRKTQSFDQVSTGNWSVEKIFTFPLEAQDNST